MRYLSELLRFSTFACDCTHQSSLILSSFIIVILQVTLYLHFLWIGPLQAAIVILLLMYAIGPSCLAGMSVFFIFMPLQTVFGRLFSTLRFVFDEQIDQL